MIQYQDSHFYKELKESDLYILTEFFKVLGNPTRIRILLLLMEQDSCVGDLAEQLGITQSAVSHQLNLLKSNKLVRRRRDGKMIFYTLFNQLTGANQHVGNFPRVTVDRKDGTIRKYSETIVTDLQGINSLSPYSIERDHKMTILLVSFMSCTAKLPIYTLVISVFPKKLSGAHYGWSACSGDHLWHFICVDFKRDEI